MISADVNSEQESKGTGRIAYLVFFYRKYLQNLGTTMYQWTYF